RSTQRVDELDGDADAAAFTLDPAIEDRISALHPANLHRVLVRVHVLPDRGRGPDAELRHIGEPGNQGVAESLTESLLRRGDTNRPEWKHGDGIWKFPGDARAHEDAALGPVKDRGHRGHQHAREHGRRQADRTSAPFENLRSPRESGVEAPADGAQPAPGTGARPQ